MRCPGSGALAQNNCRIADHCKACGALVDVGKDHRLHDHEQDDPDDVTLTSEVGRVLRDIRLLVTEGIGDEEEIMARKHRILAEIEKRDG